MKKSKNNLPKTSVKKKQDASFSRKNWLLLLLILIAVFIVYSPTLSKAFLNYDDNWMIYENSLYHPSVFSHIGEIFSTFYSGQYSPLPTVFVGIVRASAGDETFLYNLMAVLLHLISTSLVCWLVFRLFKNPFYALSAAALFGICSMNVESVAWASAAFKAGFYTSFYLGALISYTFYISSSQIKFLLTSLVLFTLSFLSKEQAVALVLSMLCIDFLFGKNFFSKKVILEKLPFLILSLIFGFVTIAANESNRLALTYSHFDFGDRVLYLCYALGEYVIKIFVPYKLAAFYPYPAPANFDVWFYFHPLIVVFLIFLFAWTAKKNKPVAFGLLFFLSNILFSLALQVVSVREVIMADRYVYVSSIGLLLIIPYSIQKLTGEYSPFKNIIYSVSALYVAIISVITYNQTKVWKNTVTLMENSLKNYSSPVPMVSLGVEQMTHGNTERALDNFNHSIKMFSDYGIAYLNRGTIYAQRGKDSLALADFNKAADLNLSSANLYANRGGLYINFGKYDLALKDFEQALKLKPNFSQAYYNRAITHIRLNDYKSAIADYGMYMKQNPRNPRVYYDRGIAYQKLEQNENAVNDFSTAITLDNTKGIYYLKRSYAYLSLGKKDLALTDALSAQQLGEQLGSDYLESLRRK
ncbi:MAG: tetratricopeptide repeat protein [Bacteroidia bacterium]|nr:tetratricopeptide repeat protein [Bacteroidia bacterium]